MSLSRRELFRQTGVAAGVAAAVASLGPSEALAESCEVEEARTYEPATSGASVSALWRMPTGYVVYLHGDAFIGHHIYDGEKWLPCIGRWVSKSKHPELYSVIRGTYGEKENHFRLPNGRSVK